MSTINIKAKRKSLVEHFQDNQQEWILALAFVLITSLFFGVALVAKNQPLPNCSTYRDSSLTNLPVRCYSYFKINTVTINTTIRTK